VEFHCHGGRAVLARLLECLGSLPGLREAEPGEFTRRGLLNARLDLTEAEGLADLLAAETEWQRRGAFTSAGGGLRSQIERWRDRLVLLAAQAEAAIDYVDEEETELELGPLAASAGQLAEEWREWLAAPRAELLQQGARIVLAGPPNAGKSSLFNALIGQEKAIVTPIAGTTRDLLEAQLDLDGMRVTLVDTAGVRESEDVVEQIGVDRARTAADEADVLVWLGAAEQQPPGRHVILVQARADERNEVTLPNAISTSVVSGAGLAELRRAMVSAVADVLPSPDRATLNRRQALALEEAATALALVTDYDALLTADALRQALHALDRLSGRQSTEDVLDALFSRFCLGK
jgi:tRNA modification GTPase